MSVSMSLGLGMIAGIVLFFVLQRRGVIDAWLARLEK